MEYVNFGSAGVKVSPIALGLGLRGQSSAQGRDYAASRAGVWGCCGNPRRNGPPMPERAAGNAPA